MKTTQEKIAVMQAFADGKKVECKPHYARSWHVNVEYNWDWEGCDYRIAPEPKLRPWKPEEVPVGALVKTKDTGSRWVLAGINYGGLVLITGDKNNFRDTKYLFDHYTHSTDHGKTWQPCGAME